MKGEIIMLNQLVVIGRLTKDPELRKTDTGRNVTTITLAVPRSYKNSNGEYDTDFIDCTLWSNVAETTTEYCHKGDLISVRGQLRTSTFTVNDEKKYSTEVVVDKIAFLANKSKDSEETKDDGE